MGSVNAYLNEIGRVAVLSKEQQLSHSRRVREWLDYDGGKDAAPKAIQRMGKRSMDRMVESNLRIVIEIAKKYTNNKAELEDLIQEGNLGLITAVEKFDPTRGYCFSTCAYWWVRQGITRFLSNQSRTIRLPCNVTEAGRKIEGYRIKVSRERGRGPSIAEIAEALSMKESQVLFTLQALSIEPQSLDGASAGHRSMETGAKHELIAAKTISDEEVEELRGLDAALESVREMVERLPTLERLSVEGVAFDRLTQREVAESLHLS